jgi:uncharacterized damage-inducible protein DinB
MEPPDRRDPRLISNEHTMVEEFLDYHRATFLGKVRGLSQEQLARTHPPSSMTLAGLVKHLAYVEDIWFQVRFLGHAVAAPWVEAPWADDPDWEFHSAPYDEPTYLIELYEAACARSRLAFASAPSLDALSVEADRKTGEKFSLRWVMLHLIEETARHNGHADLMREAIDGATGE